MKLSPVSAIAQNTQSFKAIPSKQAIAVLDGAKINVSRCRKATSPKVVAVDALLDNIANILIGVKFDIENGRVFIQQDAVNKLDIGQLGEVKGEALISRVLDLLGSYSDQKAAASFSMLS